MFRFLLLFFLLLNLQLAYAASRYVSTYTPSLHHYCSYAGQNRNISKLENKLFNRTFDYDTPEQRVERMEQQLFGVSQSGDLTKRLSNIKRANSRMNSAPSWGYSSGYDNYYTPPIIAGSGWKSMLHSFGNYMTGGVPTGITPQMDPAYMDYFEAERNAMRYNNAGRSRDIRTNYGWHHYSNQTGGTTGVKIID